jgi:hypothetical protein
MDEKRQSRLAPALIVAMVLLPVGLLALYVAGYFWGSRQHTLYLVKRPGYSTVSIYPQPGSSTYLTRDFRYGWQVKIYRPATAVESLLWGVHVNATAEFDRNKTGS